jgi:hypothetical protein
MIAMKSTVKRFFVENWRAKLMSLIVASAVWYVIKKNITTTTPDMWRQEERHERLNK